MALRHRVVFLQASHVKGTLTFSDLNQKSIPRVLGIGCNEHDPQKKEKEKEEERKTRLQVLSLE